MKRVAVVGSGFAGIAAASCLARRGYDVTVYEKNATLGGRAQLWEKDGFRFDLGPSWYWMPDVFEEYFARFGTTPGHQYTLKRLDPSYRVFLPGTDSIDVPARLSELVKIF
jgi:phytoene desaturase